MSVVDEIKQRLDIVEFISSYVPLQKAGRNYKGLCPFHAEKTPSFVVFPESQGWHCFGACSTGGDIFTFVMRRENMAFPEALRFLAERAGLDIRPLDAEEIRQRDLIDRLRAANAEAAQYYHRLLINSARAEGVQRYLERRGVRQETWATFQLGYAPNEWHSLEEHLRRLGFAADDILAAGLTVEGERGNVYDRFRHRLMFPIRDTQGHVIGFGGRALDDDTQPKYLNTSQTSLFDKGSVLYGIDLARNSVRTTETAIIVEGYMDVIVPYQEGVTNVVSCMGTALTEAHLSALKRLAKRLVLALDPDEAGIRAVEKGVETAQQVLDRQVVPIPTATGLIRYEEQLKTDIRILALPDGMDPDELILADRARWDALVAGAPPVAEYFFSLTLQDADLSTAKGKRAVADRLLPIFAAIDNPVERTHYVQRLAQRIHIDERQLLPELGRLRGGREAPPSHAAPAAERQRARRPQVGKSAATHTDLEERCLGLLLKAPHMLPEIVAMTGLSAQVFQDERNRQLFELLGAGVGQSSDDSASWENALDTALYAHVESLLLKLQNDPPLSLESLREDLAKSSARLCKHHLSRLIRELRFLQQDAQEQGTSEDVRKLNQVIEDLTHDYLRIDQRYHAATMVGRRASKERFTSSGGA